MKLMVEDSLGKPLKLKWSISVESPWKPVKLSWGDIGDVEEAAVNVNDE